jgi:HAD superfamily hydrolase (TIGR01490 family)
VDSFLSDQTTRRSDTLALFDFDGTLTYRDSFQAFLFFTLPNWRIALGAAWLSPHLLAYRAGQADNGKTKERVLRYFYQGWSVDYFEGLCHRFAREKLPGLVRPEALERLRWHQEQEHDVWLVSASLESYLWPWSRHQGVYCIGTRLLHERGCVTGRLATPNCWGPEKVRRVQELLSPERYDYIFAYGDSRGDRELLSLADYPYYRYFE